MVVTKPTIGSNVEEVKYKNLKLEVWDLGGQEKLRECWQSYFSDTQVKFMDIDKSGNNFRC